MIYQGETIENNWESYKFSIKNQRRQTRGKKKQRTNVMFRKQLQRWQNSIQLYQKPFINGLNS